MPTRVRIDAAFARPSPNQLAALAALGTATLQDAAGGRGVLDPWDVQNLTDLVRKQGIEIDWQ